MSSFFTHRLALVESETIGNGTKIWAFAHVMAGASIGSDCNIGDHAFIEAGAVVGNGVTIKNQACIWEGVRIADDVFVGPGVLFTNDRYPRSPRSPGRREHYAEKANWLVPTVVEAGVSIGAGAVIGPNVRLGRHCLIGAGAVVTRSVPPYALVLGNPARYVGDVCSCGKRLDDRFDAVDCPHCGETASLRREATLPSFEA